MSLPEYSVHPLIGLDRTVGEPIYIGDSPVSDFTFRDVNSDGLKDIIAFHDDGLVGARMNNGSDHIDIGDLLSVSEANNGMVRAGDFRGDGYADIVYVDERGLLRLVEHNSFGPSEKSFVYDKTPIL